MSKIRKINNIRAVLTSCVDGTEKHITIEFDYYKNMSKYAKPNEMVVNISAGFGVTGYESFLLTNTDKKIFSVGWHACAGTKGRWDTLYIPADQMQEMKDQIDQFMMDDKTEIVHQWMRDLSDDDKMRFKLNWRIPHSLFNVACKLYPGGGDALQDVDWYKIFKSGDLGSWSHGLKVPLTTGNLSKEGKADD